VEFCENFFLHFLENEAKTMVTSIDQRAKRAAVRARHAMKRRRAPAATIQLVTWFEKLCDIYKDLLSTGYGDTTAANFYNFHGGYLQVLLRRIIAWAKVKKH